MIGHNDFNQLEFYTDIPVPTPQPNEVLIKVEAAALNRTLYLKDLHLLGCTVLDEGVFANPVQPIESGDISLLVAATSIY